MKKIILVFLILPLFLQSQIVFDWAQTQEPYGITGKMIASDAFNNVFTVGNIVNSDIYLIKRDENGNTLWETLYDNTEASQWEIATWMILDPAGDPIVVGYTNTGFYYPYPFQLIVMKFNSSDGSLAWRKTYGTLGAGTIFRAFTCLSDGDGNIYVGGDGTFPAAGGGNTGDFILLKYDSEGTLLWEKHKDFGTYMYFETAYRMKFDNSGNIMMAGATPLPVLKLYAVKFTPAGSEIWNTSYDAISDSYYYPSACDIANAADGSTYILSSWSYGFPIPYYDIVVKKFSSTGILQWTNHYDFGGSEKGRYIEVDGAGNIVLIGSGDSPLSAYVDWLTLKLDPDGNLLWVQRYNEIEALYPENAWMMVLDNENNIYVTGSGGPQTGLPFPYPATNAVTIKYNPEGVQEGIILNSDYTGSTNYICLGTDKSIFTAGGPSAVTFHFLQTDFLICNSPSDLFTNSITTTKAKLNWTIVPGAYQYEVWYKKTTAAAWKKKFVAGINNKLNLKNLKCNTNYTWKIRTICDTVGVDLVSAFSADQFFTTLACREENYVMEDNISVYPNPAFDQIHINSGDRIISNLKIIDLTGKIVQTEFINNSGSITIDVSNLPAGTYIMSIQTPDEIINQQIIIIK